MQAHLVTKYPSVFNQYVACHPRGDVLQTTNWGQLKSNTGWRYFPLVVMEDNQIRASALILCRKLPLVKFSLFYSPRGPLFSDYAALEKLLEAGGKLAREHKAIFWKMDPAIPHGDSAWDKFSKEQRLIPVDTGTNFASVQPKFIMDLDIRPSLDTILANMKSKTRYNIRYALKRKIKTVISRNKKDLELFYPLLVETAKRDNFSVRSFSYFADLWDCLVQHNLAQLFLAYHQDQLLSGTIAFRLGKRAWYVYGASSSKLRNLQPNYAIQWEMIRWAKASGCHVYDFRGVSGDMDPSNPLYGLYRFKDGFGAKVVEYVGEYDLPLSYLGYRAWKTALPIYNKVSGKKQG